MQQHFGYYDNWKEAPLTCPHCGWSGHCGNALEEDLPDGMGFVCPTCKQIELLAIVLYPTTAESRAHWNELSASEQKAVEETEAFVAAYDARKLARPEQLPEVSLESFVVTWDQQVTDRGVDVVLRVGVQVLHTEPQTWEGFDHFIDVAKILRLRYGDRVTDLVPTPASELYLYGDQASAVADLTKQRRLIFSGQQP